MKQARRICCILLTAVMMFSSTAINVTAATIVGSVLTTDIKAYINGVEIPSYNIDGNMVVIGQDLRNYGFNVVYNNETRTSYVSYNGSGVWNPIVPLENTVQSIGTKVMDVYKSDIKVKVNGSYVDCYNVGGKMAFKFAELKVFGNYYYDNETRSSNLWVGETKSDESDTVSIVSSVVNDFDNIYIDDNGNLIFEFSDGSVINAGAVLKGIDGLDGEDGRNGLNGRDGNDGEDGVSIANAYVDSEGDLIVELSNHKVINAGNVGSSYSSNKLTFADYEVGTKFYLTQPTGEFEVTVYVDDIPYTFEFSEIYYELTAKNDFNDENSWIQSNGMAKFIPYEVTVHIDGVTDQNLAGDEIYVTLSDSSYGNFGYSIHIEDDGSFSLREKNRFHWEKPKTLIFKELEVFGKKLDEPDEETKELISYFAGTWTSPGEPDNEIVLKEDGTIIYQGKKYEPKFSCLSNKRLCAICDEINFWFNKDENMDYADTNKSKDYYYRDGSWSVISLDADNFFDYFEYNEDFYITHNAFGEWESAVIYRQYTLKDEYRLLSKYYSESEVAVKINVDTYLAEYTVDFENKTYTVTPGGFFENSFTVNEGRDNGSGFIRISLPKTTFMPDRNLRTYYYIFEVTDAKGTLYLSANTEV